MMLWQSRPLDSVYPVVLVDGIRIKIRDGAVTNRTVYVVMGINMERERDILGLWVGPTGGESPKFWLGVLTELKTEPSATVTDWPPSTTNHDHPGYTHRSTVPSPTSAMSVVSLISCR